jgi:hypothetical protein
MKIRALGAKKFHVEKQRYVQTDMTKPIAALRNVNTPKKGINAGQFKFQFLVQMRYFSSSTCPR